MEIAFGNETLSTQGDPAHESESTADRNIPTAGAAGEKTETAADDDDLILISALSVVLFALLFLREFLFRGQRNE